MAQKCLDKRVQSKQARKHKLGKRTNRSSKVQTLAAQNSKKQLKQQRQQRQGHCRLKNDFVDYSTNESHKNLDSFSLSITARNRPFYICLLSDLASELQRGWR